MIFKDKTLREIADMIIGDVSYFPYRSSSYITEFFNECDCDFVHDGSTRVLWTKDRLKELVAEQNPNANTLPPRFVKVLQILMDKGDATKDDDRDRNKALEYLNSKIHRTGFEGFYADDNFFYIRHIRSGTVAESVNPHRPLTKDEQIKRTQLAEYMDRCSEDDLIEKILFPLFRQLGYQRVTTTGHKDKSLEYGIDMWMKFTLPTTHVLYFGIQVKKGKLDAAGRTQGPNANMAEILNQTSMMLGKEIFDSEINKKVLVDHALIIAGGEITKQAKNWLGERLDSAKRSQILFMDRDDILNLYSTSTLPLPDGAVVEASYDYDDIPF